MPLAITDALLGIDALARHLTAAGWKVRTVGSAAQRGLLDLVDEPPHYLRVSGRAVSEVRLRLGGALFGQSSGTLKLGPLPVHHTRPLPMQLHWLVPLDPAGRLEAFDAKLSTRRGGLFWTGEVEHAAWTGGTLAQALDLHPERVLEGARGLRLGESLRVSPDPDRACVRIIHQSKVTVRFSLLSSEVLSAERHLPERELLDGIEWIASEILGLGRPRRTRKAAKRGRRKQ